MRAWHTLKLTGGIVHVATRLSYVVEIWPLSGGAYPGGELDGGMPGLGLVDGITAVFRPSSEKL